MPDNETIKHLDITKSYLRCFFLYGCYARRDYAKFGALRSYDNERQRIEVWYGDSFKSRMDGKEKVYAIAAERDVAHNPFYEVFKAKSVTSKSFLVHYLVLDALSDYNYASFNDITGRISANGKEDFIYIIDDSTIKDTINKLVSMGLVERSKLDKKTVLYRICRAEFAIEKYSDAIAFFSEANELGVIGSYISDRASLDGEKFIYRHRYLQHALDSELLFKLFGAITDKRSIKIVYFKNKDSEQQLEMVPLKLFVSTQMGRRFIVGWSPRDKNYVTRRLDMVKTISLGEVCTNFDEMLDGLKDRMKHTWGVNFGSNRTPLTKVEIVFSISDSMSYLADRIRREKRCGEIEETYKNQLNFRAEVYDALELMPWIRTYIGNIVSIKTSNHELERKLREDLKALNSLYEGTIKE